tara:strand:+ start:1993 stop:2151 length:159 start_codon:yes stop_codon:yes gene_type:complete
MCTEPRTKSNKQLRTGGAEETAREVEGKEEEEDKAGRGEELEHAGEVMTKLR